MSASDFTEDLDLSKVACLNRINGVADDGITLQPDTESYHQQSNDDINSTELNEAAVLLNNLLIASYATKKFEAYQTGIASQIFYNESYASLHQLQLPKDILSLLDCADNTVRKVF